jgi:hypothetical protein
MVVDQARRHRHPFARIGEAFRPSLPSSEELRSKELHEVIASLGRPFTTAHLGLRHLVAYWTFGRHWIEIVFDEHNRVERISIS